MPASSRRGPMINPFAFYRAVPLHSPYLRAALAATTAVAIATLVFKPSSGAQVVVPIVLLQMFAASTGFAVPARRGHYDLLITGGASRLRIAASHFTVSIAPGIAAWLLLACVELALAGGRPRTLAAGSVVTMLLVSSLAWAISVPLPRLSGGIMWVLAVVMLLTTTERWRAPEWISSDPVAFATGALLYLLCPFALVGQPLAGGAAWMVLPAVGLSAAAVASALTWITRVDLPLEASQ